MGVQWLKVDGVWSEVWTARDGRQYVVVSGKRHYFSAKQ